MMQEFDPQDWSRLQEVFAAAVTEPPALRIDHVRQAFHDRPALADYAFQMLENHEQIEREELDRSVERQDTLIGARIGTYTLMRRIGEGTFGAVYLAEQDVPFRRQVAIKIIKLGMDTEHVIARFEQERQTLAFMHHPGIASVLDAGATGSGRPYFVMEYFPGQSITDYANSARMTIERRLLMFRDVCDAVRHAHQKGLIHRDLKPSNILVAEIDGRPVVKVIDFGVAKATVASLLDAPLRTIDGRPIGTRGYMSPEQSRGSADVDTRGDVFSLGVLLYKLLTGTTPYEVARSTAAAASFHDAGSGGSEISVDEMPPRPSALLTKNPRVLAAASDACSLAPAALQKSLRGDLDWVVSRAIEPDRERRYDSVALFASDVDRYLRREPVVAAPPSMAYRIRKFVHRRKGLVFSFAAVALTIAVAFIGTTIALRRALLAEDHERSQRQIAQRHFATMNEVAKEFSARLIDVDPAALGAVIRERLNAKLQMQPDAIDPNDELVTAAAATDVAREAVRSLLAGQSADSIDERYPQSPEVRGMLHAAYGNAYISLGLYAEGVSLLRSAYRDLCEMPGPNSVEALEARVTLAETLLLVSDFSGAEEHFTSTMESLGDAEDDQPALMSRCLVGLARLATTRADFKAGVSFASSAVNHARLVSGDDVLLVRALLTLSEAHRKYGEVPAAYAASSEAVSIGRGRALFDPASLARALSETALVLQSNGNFEQSLGTLAEAIQVYSAHLGTMHPETISAIATSSEALAALGNPEEADRGLQIAIAIRRQVVPGGDLELAAMLAQLGMVRRMQACFDDAEAYYEEAGKLVLRFVGSEHPSYAGILNDIGRLAVHRSRGASQEEAVALAAKAEPVLALAAEINARTLPPRHINVAITNDALIWARTTLGRYRDAEVALRNAWPPIEDLPPQRVRFMPNILSRFAALYDAWDRAEPGCGHAAQAAEWREVFRQWQAKSEAWKAQGMSLFPTDNELGRQ